MLCVLLVVLPCCLFTFAVHTCFRAIASSFYSLNNTHSNHSTNISFVCDWIRGEAGGQCLRLLFYAWDNMRWFGKDERGEHVDTAWEWTWKLLLWEDKYSVVKGK